MSTVATTLAAPPARGRFEHARDVIAVLVSRDLKILYKRSVVGVLWAVISPLLQVSIFVLVFRHALSAPGEDYAAFVFTGVLVWGWFHASLLQCTSLITSNRALVRQPRFPLTLLPVVTIAVRLFHFSLALPILFGLLLLRDVHPAMSWLALPVLLVVQFALIAGLGYPLAALNVRLRDTQHVTAVLLQLLMYMTPVFYRIDAVPAAIRPWLYLNPMVALLDAWREILLHGRWPDPAQLGVLAVVAGTLLLVGRWTFQKESRRFMEEM